ncbi:MAG: TylF/MycF/NovP-related O-methyltransferase [Clostridia bacterium]|nr:TylF/MycF/NovP-related O-methyltransferase [Clostridia bacterium]
MKKVVVIGCSSLIVSAAELLNPLEMKVVGLGDTRPEAWNVFKENGDLKDEFDEIPIMPVDLTVGFEPDVIVIAVLEESAADSLRYAVIRAGYTGDIIFMSELAERFCVRGAALRHAAQRLERLGVPGAVAELGCYRGDTSWQLNALMPGRKLYLFDTFSGFDARDLAEEAKIEGSSARPGRFADAKAEELPLRLPAPENAIVKKGWFPETALDMEDETFALVCLDASLYAPTLSALKFFFPRMSRGGVIVLFGLADPNYPGVSKAVEDFEDQYGALLMFPIGDLTGTALIVHP